MGHRVELTFRVPGDVDEARTDGHRRRHALILMLIACDMNDIAIPFYRGLECHDLSSQLVPSLGMSSAA